MAALLGGQAKLPFDEFVDKSVTAQGELKLENGDCRKILQSEIDRINAKKAS